MKATFLQHKRSRTTPNKFFKKGDVIEVRPRIYANQHLSLESHEYAGIDGMSLVTHGNPFRMGQ